MAKFSVRVRLIEVALFLAAVGVVTRAAQLQLVEGRAWRAEAERAREERRELPARRGGIYDRNEAALALTQEYFHVGIAPNELRDRARDVRVIARSLDLPLGDVQKDVATRKWVWYGGPFTGLAVRPLRDIHGVHLEGEYSRHYPAGSLARSVLGSLSPDSSRGLTGVEMALDSALTGVPGVAVVLKDRAGRRYDSPSRREREPVPGLDVELTIDAELQEIAERALDDAMREWKASGGDVVILEPRTGELLALAARQTAPEGRVTNRPSFFTDPFEPGSTAKLFTAAALLALDRVDTTDEVYGENGEWVMPTSGGQTRRITDAHKTVGNLTLARAIQVSSNIAMAKFSQRLTATEQYDFLRDFGFGSPTGVEFPAESPGSLIRPERWLPGYNGPSTAMGYSFAVTPVQLAAAYAAIANEGVLVTPSLVREIRRPDGLAVYHHRPEPVRRVLSKAVAQRLRGYLAGAVGEGGTGEKAQLVNYTLLGKTGTAQRFIDGQYVRGTYVASFAALFPAEDPQLVVIVKIDDPKGEYYGGLTAAPLTRVMLEEALASRQSAIDRRRLAEGRDLAPAAPSQAQPAEPEDEEPPSVAVVRWPLVEDSTAGRPRLPVPNVLGTSVRRAANTLHRRGFQVTLRGGGTVRQSSPAPGDSMPRGSTITIWAQ
jgi:cell division protein FtsI (penicillin-binding protein 3)